jgi:hypothetical protein
MISLIRYCRKPQFVFACVALFAFVLYWMSALALEARGGTTHFHVDTWLYSELAVDDVFSRITPDSQISRIFRFHPTTVVLAAGWMKVVKPLTRWFEALHLLKGLFAAVGALGVWAALWAFAAVVPYRYVLLWGGAYASSLGIWYFSSIEESKIVTATLTACYIATYMHLRTDWTWRKATLLTAILVVACLNEIVAALLVIIPAVDALVQRGWRALTGWWIATHALVPPFALVLLESVMRGWSRVVGTHPEGSNHFSMFFWYVAQNEISAHSVKEFIARWFFFNIAAPERHADHWANPSIKFGGIFYPTLSTYLDSPLPATVAGLFALIVAIIVLGPKRVTASTTASLVWALFAFASARAIVFFFFNAKECMLFSPSVTLPHLLFLALPFTAADLAERAKGVLLALFVAVLFLTNGLFIIG